MVQITLTNDEETITVVANDTTEVTNCISFQNVTEPLNGCSGISVANATQVRWSSIDFSATNKGAVAERFDARIFSTARSIFFKNDTTEDKEVQVRKVAL